MRSKESIIKEMLATLHELEAGRLSGELETHQRYKLMILYDILEDDAPREFWDRIEDEIDLLY